MVFKNVVWYYTTCLIIGGVEMFDSLELWSKNAKKFQSHS